MSLGKYLGTGLLCAVIAAVSPACGDDDDDGGGGGDDSTDDGGTTVDAGGGGADAAPVATHTGQVLLLQGQFLSFPELGQGVIAEATFQAKADLVPPSFEESPGSPFACKAFEFTPETFAPAGRDEGTVQYTIDGGPEIPPCAYVPGQGYRCVGAMGTGGDIQVIDQVMGLYSLTDAQITLGGDEVGRFLVVNGAKTPANNGQFPIVMAMGDNTVAFLNTQGGAEELATAGTYLTVAGFGPAGQTAPVADDAQVTFALTAGGEGDVAEYSQAVDIGNAFTLDTASQTAINAVPVDGSEFTISCDGEGGDCGASAATLVNLIGTDGDITGLPPFVLPPPQSKAVQIFCVFLAGRATVPAAASQYLVDSGATRIRTVFVRANNMLFNQAKIEMQVAAGHAVAGFTDPPQ
jgi:hypothetical protein